MFGKMNVGIIGTGNIASTMAGTLNRMKNAKLYAVASRDKVRADVFAGKHGCKKAYGSYEELALDKKVDLIYIATPNSEHYANAKMCLEHGKPVLCEKSFTANACQAEELIRLSEEKGVLLAEAMWTRYLPMLTTLKEVIESGVIGEPRTIEASLGAAIENVERLKNPALAGGALLDIGVYPLNFALMLFGHGISKIHSNCTYSEVGLDEQNSITLQYADGKVAHIASSMVSWGGNKGVVYGTKGFIIVEDIHNCETIEVYEPSGKKAAQYKRPKQITGYEYEVEACIKAIMDNRTECVQMPHGETLRVMKLMDSFRNEWGIVYPFEKTEAAEQKEEN